jgi:cysteine synthase
MNPTGSLKDRIYYEMITRAIERHDLRPGMEILEASAGNAGIACAFVGTRLGYPVTIVVLLGMSQERMKMIRAYGGRIINTPGAESDVDLCIKKMEESKQDNPGKGWRRACRLHRNMWLSRLECASFGNQHLHRKFTCGESGSRRYSMSSFLCLRQHGGHLSTSKPLICRLRSEPRKISVSDC